VRRKFLSADILSANVATALLLIMKTPMLKMMVWCFCD